MSRSNRKHYTCEHCDLLGEPCQFHETRKWSKYTHRPSRLILGRRTYYRKPRRRHSIWNIFHRPPAEMKRVWAKRIRAIQEREVGRNGEVATPYRKVIRGWLDRWT